MAVSSEQPSANGRRRAAMPFAAAVEAPDSEAAEGESLGLAGMPESILDGLGEAIVRLQDPHNYDHTTLPLMLRKFKARDLEKSKLYRLAKSIYGDRMDPKAKHRTRVFVLEGSGKQPAAAQLAFEDKLLQQRLKQRQHRPDSSAEFADVSNCDAWDLGAVRLGPELQAANDSACGGSSGSSSEGGAGSASQAEEYDRWISERKQLRHDLDRLGLSEQWLAGKPSLTDVEDSLLKKMVALRLRKQQLKVKSDMEGADKVDELRPRPSVLGNIPLIRRPSPLALRTLESYLAANKLRLLDLFSAIDKQKAWKVSKDDFVRGLKERDMHISESLLGDLIMTLDANDEGMLNYKDLATGMSIWRMEKRESKSRGAVDPDPATDDDNELVFMPSSKSRTPLATETGQSLGAGSPQRQRSRSGVSAVSSASTMLLLEPPQPDVREERYVLGSAEEQVDARKRDMAAHLLRKRLEATGSGHRSVSSSSQHKLSSSSGGGGSGRPSPAAAAAFVVVPVGGVFKTGYRPVDDHCRSSTLDIEAAERTDRFRQLKLKEYYEVLNLCQKSGITLDRDLLDRVLLHPGDKSSRILLKQGLRQAGAELPLSRHFADPPKRPRTPIEIRNKHKMKRNEKGELLIDYRHQFPPGATVNTKPERIVLSTGKAYVNRKVDCWMTFEEYENLMSEYKTRYVKLHGETNPDAFWPGQVLDKMRLVLDGDRTSEPSNAVFHHVRKETRHNFGYDNDLNNWTVSNAGYLVQGSLRHPKS